VGCAVIILAIQRFGGLNPSEYSNPRGGGGVHWLLACVVLSRYEHNAEQLFGLVVIAWRIYKFRAHWGGVDSRNGFAEKRIGEKWLNSSGLA